MPYKTTFTVEVISENPIPFNAALGYIAEGIDSGNYSGVVVKESPVEMDNHETALALQAQGSDPEFILGENGWKYALHKGDEITVDGKTSKIVYIEYKRGAGYGCVDLILENGDKHNCLSLDEIS